MFNPFQINEFAGISLGREKIRAVLARRSGKRLAIVRCAVREFADGELGRALKAVLAELAPGAETVIVLAAPLPGDDCFGTELPPLKTREIAAALAFELPRHLPRVPENPQLEFISTGRADGLDRLSCRVYPAAAAEPLFAALSENTLRIDVLAHPLLLLPPLPVGARVALPELGTEFCWCDRNWTFAAPELPLNRELDAVLTERFDGGTDDFAALRKEFITPLCAVLFAARRDFFRARSGLGVLPEPYRPRRYRRLLRLAGVLTLLLIGCFALRGFGELRSFRTEYLRIRNRTAELEERTDKIKRQLAKRDKEFKELRRVMDLEPGDHRILQKLALIAEKIPKEAQLTQFRAGEGTIDLTLQSESAGLDPATPLRRGAGFRINRQQQRRVGDTLNIITIQLGTREGKR